MGDVCSKLSSMLFAVIVVLNALIFFALFDYICEVGKLLVIYLICLFTVYNGL